MLPHLSSAQVASQDPNFTPSVLKSGLSGPHGVVFRPPTGDLVLSLNGVGQVSLVNATSGAAKSFATQSLANQIAVRSRDGVVAVRTGSAGDRFYSSGGTLLGSDSRGGLLHSGIAFDAGGSAFVAAGVNFGVANPTRCMNSRGRRPGCDTTIFLRSLLTGATISKVWHFLRPRLHLPDPELCTQLARRLVVSSGYLSRTVGTTFPINSIATAPSSFSRGASRSIPFRVTSTFRSSGKMSSEMHPPPDASCDVECLAAPSPFATGFAIPSG